MENKIDRIRKKFNDQYIFVSNQWIEQQLSKNGLNDNFDFIYRQWLNTNLLELDYSTVNIPDTLPERFITPAQKFNLNLTFQIIKLQDVSRLSPNDYCEDLYKKKTDDDENQPQNQETNNYQQQQQNVRFNQISKNRQLYFVLFNGKKLVHAFEYESLNQLNLENCYKGAKLLITGEVDLSYDVLLLRSKNVKVLGGNRIDINFDNI